VDDADPFPIGESFGRESMMAKGKLVNPGIQEEQRPESGLEMPGSAYYSFPHHLLMEVLNVQVIGNLSQTISRRDRDVQRIVYFRLYFKTSP
jgi:hypothetical protein